MYTISYPSGTLLLDGAPLTDWPAYVAFLEAGNGPTEVPEPPVLERIEVTAWQIRKALNQTALRQQVEDAVTASMSLELKDGWLHSPTFYSDNPLTLAMGASLGKSAAEMYQLFQLAESL